MIYHPLSVAGMFFPFVGHLPSSVELGPYLRLATQYMECTTLSYFVPSIFCPNTFIVMHIFVWCIQSCIE